MTRRYEHEPTQVMKVTREEVVCDLCGLTLQASPPEKLDYWYHHLEHYQIDDIGFRMLTPRELLVPTSCR